VKSLFRLPIGFALPLLFALTFEGCVEYVPASDATRSPSSSARSQSAARARGSERIEARTKLEAADAAKSDASHAESLYAEAYEFAKAKLGEKQDAGRLSDETKKDLLGIMVAAQTGRLESMRAQGRTVEELGVLARSATDCDAGGSDAASRCRAELGRLRDENTCAFDANLHIHSMMDAAAGVKTWLDDDLAAEDMTMLTRWSKDCKGYVLQRAHLTGKRAEGDLAVATIEGHNQTTGPGKECQDLLHFTFEEREYVLKRCHRTPPMHFVGATLRLQVPADDVKSVTTSFGEVVWLAFMPSALHRTGNVWDARPARIFALH
jgi:hypothetical protein